MIAVVFTHVLTQYQVVCLNQQLMDFTKSLASERSRDITFTVPWFQIKTLIVTQTITLINTPNHTLTLTRSQTLNRATNEAFSPA